MADLLEMPEWFDVVAARVLLIVNGRVVDRVSFLIVTVKHYDGTLTIETVTTRSVKASVV